MTKIIGAFVFKDDGDGCLTAKWLNNNELTPYPEACKLTTKEDGSYEFEGTYISTWIETNTVVVESSLKISRLPSGVYDLLWFKGTKTIFIGRAMIYGDLLIGSYWD